MPLGYWRQQCSRKVRDQHQFGIGIDSRTRDQGQEPCLRRELGRKVVALDAPRSESRARELRTRSAGAEIVLAQPAPQPEDQYDNLAAHTQKGIEFLDKYGNFVKERCAIELEYAGKLRRLVKNYQPKRKEEDEYQYTPCKAFRQLLQELSDFAGQREVVAENLQSNVVRELHLLAKELREERKLQLNEGAKQMAILNSAISALDRARRAYERAARESERALEAFQKADADLNLSRADVEKQKMNMKSRSQACEDAKQEYIEQIRKTNEAQRQHYEQRLPYAFKQLQDLDEKRIKNIKNFMLSSIDVEKKVFPIIMKCLDGMVQAANSINEKEDTQLVIDRYKSGFLPPDDYSFEEQQRGGSDSTDSAPPHHQNHHHHQHHTVRGTVSANRVKKRGGLLSIFSSNKNNVSVDGKEDYSDLPPNQKKKRLAAKVQELSKQVAQEQAAMDGLMKMKGVYESNPTLGDPMTVEGQLNECCDKLKKLRAQLRKFEELLAEASNAVPPPATLHPAARTNGAHPHPPADSIGSNNSESLSRSASESSVSTGAGGAQTHGGVGNAGAGGGAVRAAGGSPESGLGGELAAAHHDHADTDPDHDNDHESDFDFYYEPDLQPLGYCRALYPFEVESEGERERERKRQGKRKRDGLGERAKGNEKVGVTNGTGSTMRMECGEKLLVLETDAGDGWTRVRRHHTREEGFVPTTYIATTLYADAH
ncbi:Formin-binding protein 1-like [Eumeta japonica]|uniref:Formin-binding protein 1-like n=1 Tax=Eumeta variegata TaxID=151549 RepID=A0A4C1WN91_EUMVA|nr:Formin-binding protein 1-like [Eumeta japonica]